MNDKLLFHMYEPVRQSLIDEHLSYLKQARKRLLHQFNDIGNETDIATKEWEEKHAHDFDHDNADPSSFYEAVSNAELNFYQLLGEMRDQTYLNVVACIYHDWDKKLREWLVKEVHYWHQGKTAPEKIWNANFTEIIDLLECLPWSIRSTNYFKKIDTCRLVVNVYKHGKGKALTDLKKYYPEYLNSTCINPTIDTWFHKMADHTNLIVNDEQLQSFSDAIVKFWQNFPEKSYESKINTFPTWLKKAITEDYKMMAR